MRLSRHSRAAVTAAGVLVLAGVVSPASVSAVPPAGGQCLGPWVENTTLVNPDDPGFFDAIDKNGDGTICIKDWTGPDPDPDVGFLAIDNTGRHNQ